MTQEVKSQICLTGGTIKYTSEFFADWTVPLSEVRLIGECTNQDGPMVDDYFICFASDAQGWLEASFYSEGRDSFLKEVGQALGVEVELGLCNSTDFKSRILWPENLAGRPMFIYSDQVPKSKIGRLFGSMRDTQTFSNEAISVLECT